jgi:hypothetical protein
MPQTVALQRGTSSITLDGTTKYTMFTQSGGIATRVIINAVSFYADSVRSGMMGGIFVNKSGGGTFTIALLIMSNNVSQANLDFRPGNMNNLGGATNGTGTQFSGITVVQGTTSGNYYADTLISNFGLSGGPNASTGFGSQSNYEFTPTQFWIGPSDVVVFKARNNSADSGQVAWSFTTITES